MPAGRCRPRGVNSTSPATFEFCPPWTQGPITSRWGDFLAWRERLVVHRDLPRPRVVPAGDVQDGNVGVIAHVIHDRHSLDVPERAIRARSASPRPATPHTRGRPGGASFPAGPAGCRRAGGSAGRSRPAPVASAGLASAARLLGAPVWKIQFMNRSSNAPPCRIPLTPQFDTASIGTIVVRWGGFISASACCVPPG